jgi:hypothetical protein
MTLLQAFTLGLSFAVFVLASWVTWICEPMPRGGGKR